MKRISYWFLSTLSAFVLLFAFDASQRGDAGAAGTATISGGTSGTTSGSGSGNNGSGNNGSGNNGSGSSNDSSGGTGSGNGPGTPSNPGSSGSPGNSSGSKSSPTKTVTGAVAQTQWGPVQVELTVSNGSITRVTILQYPNGNSRDVEIANYSLPILIQETMSSQSANIDMVSGATFTSDGYLQSLQSALDQANL